MAMAIGIQPPSTILKVFDSRKAPSTIRNPPVSISVLDFDHPHLVVATKWNRIEVMPIVPVTAMP